MTDFYRFPAMAKLGEWTLEQQMKKTREETADVEEAYELIERVSPYTAPEDVLVRRMNFGIEVMDKMHSDETLLRMMFSDEEVENLRAAVEDKNRKRGYYDD